MPTIQDLTTDPKPTWCPGCGDFTILASLKNALAELDIPQKDTVLVSGIGCGSKTPHYVKTYGFEGLHGRILPVATGVKLSNNKLTVIGVGGDGDGYGIGTCHFVHTARRNIDMTYLVQNNRVYGLTKGQYSPTSMKNFKTSTSPHGSIEQGFNPIAQAIISGATFVARGFALDIEHLKSLIVQAVKHKGFALIDVFQPCVTFNKINTAQWYKERLYKIAEDHDPTSMSAALRKSREFGDRIPYGVFYKADKQTYEDQLPQIQDIPLVKQDISNIDMGKFFSKLK
ncbi:2-oxoacid:ferredoxin oxidoreductase subunit beta [Nanoarchaeota archaeon]